MLASDYWKEKYLNHLEKYSKSLSTRSADEDDEDDEIIENVCAKNDSISLCKVDETCLLSILDELSIDSKNISHLQICLRLLVEGQKIPDEYLEFYCKIFSKQKSDSPQVLELKTQILEQILLIK